MSWPGWSRPSTSNLKIDNQVVDARRTAGHDGDSRQFSTGDSRRAAFAVAPHAAPRQVGNRAESWFVRLSVRCVRVKVESRHRSSAYSLRGHFQKSRSFGSGRDRRALAWVGRAPARAFHRALPQRAVEALLQRAGISGLRPQDRGRDRILGRLGDARARARAAETGELNPPSASLASHFYSV